MKGRLLWLTEHHPPARGGMAQSCTRIISGLGQAGWIVDVCHLAVPHGSLSGPSCRWQRALHGDYQWLPATPDPYHAMRVNLGMLQEQARSWDAIVAFGGRLPAEMGPVLAALLDMPLVLMLRGNDFDLGVLRARHRAVLSDAIRASRLVCAVTEQMRREVRCLFPGTEVVTVTNGIDLADWRALPSEVTQAERWRESVGAATVIALIGHLKEKKGGAFFVRALDSVAQGRGVHLLLVGEADEMLEAAIADCRHPITRLPFLDRGELVPWYLASDFVALPSFYDGLPNVMLEAMGLGRPLIASRIGGMADHLVDGEQGFLFGPGDFDGLRLAIDRAVDSNPSQRAMMGEAGQRLVADRLSAQRESESYDRLLARVAQVGDD